MAAKGQNMPPNITRKRQKVIMANKSTNSTKNGKQTARFVIGGFGDGTKKGEIASTSGWNAGKCYPRTAYKSLRK